VTRFFRKMALSDARSFTWRLVQGPLFWKYFILFVALMGTALLASGLIDIWLTYRDHRVVLIRIQREQAGAAASKITQFVKEIEGQLGWMTHLSWADPAMDQRQLDAIRLFRQVPAIAELALLDDQGREQLVVSRQAMDRVGSNIDLSADERFRAALANKVYFGPVYFRRGTEPFMSLAVAGARRDAGVVIAEVNLKHIWDVIHQIRVGLKGRAYVVDTGGRLIAHPDISLVLRNTDLSQLPQVRSARAQIGTASSDERNQAIDVYGKRVLTAHAPAEPLDWIVFVELPEDEANEPLYAVVWRSVLILLAGLLLALFAALLLARRVVVPIQTLIAGAARIGTGALEHRITIKTGDELEQLGQQFNRMATQLQGSYATLERKVEERTHELQIANLSKSRFLAAASHDLRQPLHALNLFVAQLRLETDRTEQGRLAARIDTAVANMNELFNALLDISKLDAGALKPSISQFPIDSVVTRIASTFAATAHEKGLRLRVVRSSAWVRSDAILLERILLNLVSNAIRYTPEGGVVVGCRRAGDRLRIAVCDSGFGIPADQQRNVFGEFFQLAADGRDRREGLGLGLAIVERLGALLEHPISVSSMVGKGSCFSVTVPIVPPAAISVDPPASLTALLDLLHGKLVVVIDDDALVLDGMGGLLKSWGCRVVTAVTDREAIASLGGNLPDLIISDFRLHEGRSGIDVITALRNAFHVPIPAFLVSGDISSDSLREAQAGGLHLLHKPVSPMALRAVMSRLLKDRPRL